MRCLPGLALAQALVLTLAGCASSTPDVRTLATGRSDASAYELTGQDLTSLRQQAQRLCPLGGEILRQAGPVTAPELAATRWRRALDGALALAEPPSQPAQMLVVCKQPGEHARLQAVAAVAPPAAPGAAAPASAAPGKPAAAGQWTAALPVGPITPEW